MTETITAQEAWEAVERLKLTVDYNRLLNEWCADTRDPLAGRAQLGWGATPLEAVTHLLVRIGETVTKVEVASATSG